MVSVVFIFPKYFQKIDLDIQNTDIFLIIAIKKIVKNITVMVSDQ